MDHPPPSADPELPALLSVPTAARLLGLSRASAYRYDAAGELPTNDTGGGCTSSAPGSQTCSVTAARQPGGKRTDGPLVSRRTPVRRVKAIGGPSFSYHSRVPPLLTPHSYCHGASVDRYDRVYAPNQHLRSPKPSFDLLTVKCYTFCDTTSQFLRRTLVLTIRTPATPHTRAAAGPAAQTHQDPNTPQTGQHPRHADHFPTFTSTPATPDQSRHTRCARVHAGYSPGARYLVPAVARAPWFLT
jgi:hypothetical protein